MFRFVRYSSLKTLFPISRKSLRGRDQCGQAATTVVLEIGASGASHVNRAQYSQQPFAPGSLRLLWLIRSCEDPEIYQDLLLRMNSQMRHLVALAAPLLIDQIPPTMRQSGTKFRRRRDGSLK